MKLIKYDNKNIISFYIENGLEFDEKKGYFGKNVETYIMKEDTKIVGAFSISIYKNNSFIEAIAIDKKYRNKGYGNILLKEAINKLKSPIYIISKADKFFIRNGFLYDNADLIDNECKECSEYNNTCFPKVMIYEF